MSQFFRTRSLSLTMVVLVVLYILLVQSAISYSTTFGPLAGLLRGWDGTGLPEAGLALRAALAALLVALWLLNRKHALFKAIIVVTSLLTVGLSINLIALITVLFGITPQVVRVLLTDVVLMAISNILIFSIWYWIIDPPGVEEIPRDDEPWDFLFPQRGDEIPNYQSWQPCYSDYLHVAFTTSFVYILLVNDRPVPGTRLSAHPKDNHR